MSKGEEGVLDPKQSHHASHVIRLEEGDALGLFDGQGGEYQAQIIEKSRQGIRFKICDKRVHEKEKRIIDIAVAWVKEKALRFIVEKSSELGVQHIFFVKSAYSQGVSEKQERGILDRLQEVAYESIKQCRRPFFLSLKSVNSYQEIWEKSPESYAIIFCKHQEKQQVLKLSPNKRWLFCIGPEGGFSDQEEEVFFKNDAESISLSPYILRTETAALAAASYAHHNF